MKGAMIRLGKFIGQDETPKTTILLTYGGGANGKFTGISDGNKNDKCTGDNIATYTS